MRHQDGVALVSVLLITAIAATAAVAMATQQQIDIRRTANTLEGDRAYLFALGVESWAGRILVQDRRESQTDHLNEDWATVLPPLEVEGATVAGQLADLQGRFNLNNLIHNQQVSDIDLARFRRLLEVLEIEPTTSEAVVDWLDADSEPRFPDGAEDSVYGRAEPGYRAANRAMVSVSELRAIQGVDREVYDKLEPYVTALPERTAVNVNTAPAPVLQSLGEGITRGDAEALVEHRQEEAFDSVEAFLRHDALAGRQVSQEGLAVSSHFFLLTADSEFGRGRTRLFSVLARGDDGRVSVVLRGQGVY